MAIISCELELHFRKNGSYPDTLKQLGGPLPHDIFDGQPYRYRKTPNGRYELRSVSWNQIDDASIADKPARGIHDDLIWCYP